MGLYGRAFKLQSPANHDLGAPARGNPNEGRYTEESGFLSFYEICSQKNLTVVDENPAGAPYGYSGDLWVGFDTPKSLVKKVRYLKEKGLRGAMFWAVDLDDFTSVCDVKNPLLTAVTKALEGTVTATDDTEGGTGDATGGGTGDETGGPGKGTGGKTGAPGEVAGGNGGGTGASGKGTAGGGTEGHGGGTEDGIGSNGSGIEGGIEGNGGGTEGHGGETESNGGQIGNIKPGSCRGVPPWATPAMDKWCNDNCPRGFCPPSRCKCEYIPKSGLGGETEGKGGGIKDNGGGIDGGTGGGTEGNGDGTDGGTAGGTEGNGGGTEGNGSGTEGNGGRTKGGTGGPGEGTDNGSGTGAPGEGTGAPGKGTGSNGGQTGNIKPGSCRGVAPWATRAMDKWCNDNCPRGFCPASRCECEYITKSSNGCKTGGNKCETAGNGGDTGSNRGDTGGNRGETGSETGDVGNGGGTGGNGDVTESNGGGTGGNGGVTGGGTGDGGNGGGTGNIKPGSCRGVPPWATTAMDKWCNANCPLGFCPASRCKCEYITKSGSLKTNMSYNS